MDKVNLEKKFNNSINNIIDNNKLFHAYIIEINDYNTDFIYIMNFVKKILCNYNVDANNLKECRKCNLCNLIDNNNYPDLYIIEPDGKIIKKEQLIKLKKDFENKSLFNNKKVYIIREADKLNEASANTMLKFIEEPEDDIIAILVTTNRYMIIDTILSRCQIIKINSENGLFINDDIFDLLNYIIRGPNLFINYNDIVNNILIDKKTCIEKLKNIQKIFVDYLMNKEDNIYKEVLVAVSDKVIVKLSLIIDQYIKRLDFNVNFKLWLDSLFASIIGCENDV